jgi:hypothetical protein
MWREPGATHDVGVRHLFTAALLAVWLAGAPRAWSFTAARLTITPGTADCGGPALSRPPAAPFAGAIHGDTGCAVPTGDTSGLGRCEAGAAKAFARFAGDMIACEIAQARGVFRKEADSIAIADAAAACKHAAPGNSARARLEAARPRTRARSSRARSRSTP